MNSAPAKIRGSASRSRGWKTRRWSPAAASSPATSISRISCTCAWCARRTPTAASSRSIWPRRGRCPACSRCGARPTSPTCRRSIFARAPSRRSLRIASRCWRTARCAMSASRSPRCSPTTPTSPKTPPISSPWRSRNCRRCSTPQAAPVEFSPGHNTEAAIIRQGYGDVDAVFRTAKHVVEVELAIGRHSGVPLETRGAIGRYDASRDILELHGAAKVPHRNQELLSRMLKIPPSRNSCPRIPRRRRLRHPRRALSRGRAGLRRRDTVQSPGEMDRGPPRASDRRQSFAPAIASRSAPRSMPTATSSPSTTCISTTTAPMCAPMPHEWCT